MSVQPSALIETERWVRGSSGSSGCVMRITLSVKGGARPTIGHRDERVAFLYEWTSQRQIRPRKSGESAKFVFCERCHREVLRGIKPPNDLRLRDPSVPRDDTVGTSTIIRAGCGGAGWNDERATTCRSA